MLSFVFKNDKVRLDGRPDKQQEDISISKDQGGSQDELSGGKEIDIGVSLSSLSASALLANKKGTKRSSLHFSSSFVDGRLIPLLLTALAFYTRLQGIERGAYVAWDEAHFGLFASYYIRRSYYFDVHPPLGKMIIALVGWITGYDGSFDFKGGTTYPSHVPYADMRRGVACFGALTIPTAYFTAIELRYSRPAAILAASMLLLDNALLTTSRFILLDSIMLFFICSTVLCLVKFHSLQRDEQQRFTTWWWQWLGLTGLSIGCVISVKWVGLLVTILVGLYTIQDLWEMLGDMSMPLRTYFKHWMARIVMLIILPITIYVSSFIIHFVILKESGPGSPIMTSLFQAKLDSESFIQPRDVLYGSKVTLRSNLLSGSLLHSHHQRYPESLESSGQQQVTCGVQYDKNDDWVIYKPHGYLCHNNEADGAAGYYTHGSNMARSINPCISLDAEAMHVRHLDVIRLVHNSTGRNLHSHPIPAPLTEGTWEVSAYGNRTWGDDNDLWRIEIVKQLVVVKEDDHNNDGEESCKNDCHKEEEEDHYLHAVTTGFRLRHVRLGCILRQQHRILPDWGFKQREVVCDPDADEDNYGSIWNIEHHWNNALADISMSPPKPSPLSSFFSDMANLHAAITSAHDSMIPKQGKSKVPASSWLQWPFLQVGIRMSSWSDDTTKFYMLGNPIIWWSSSATLVLLCMLWGFYSIRAQRKCVGDWGAEGEEWQAFALPSKLFGLGYLLHYLPFGAMARVTYLHHYLPALYFSIMIVPFFIDHCLHRLFCGSKNDTGAYCMYMKWVVHGGMLAVMAWAFYQFRAVSYGIEGPAQEMLGHLKWRKTWHLAD